MAFIPGVLMKYLIPLLGLLLLGCTDYPRSHDYRKWYCESYSEGTYAHHPFDDTIGLCFSKNFRCEVEGTVNTAGEIKHQARLENCSLLP